jgi:hypothetical protein
VTAAQFEDQEGRDLVEAIHARKRLAEATAKVLEVLKNQPASVMVCYSKCWGCMFNDHDPKWHTWADGDDVAHALSIGRPDPSSQRCGCYCQREATPATTREPFDYDAPLPDLHIRKARSWEPAARHYRDLTQDERTDHTTGTP